MSMTPAQTGFRMPAEWEPHTATWLAWPHNIDDWPGKFAPIPWVYADIVKKLSAVERVRILVAHEAAERRVRSLLKKAGAHVAAVDFYHHPTDRSWTRDFCPIFVKNAAGEVAITDWQFNGWAKYDNWQNDDSIPAWLSSQLRLPHWQPSLENRRLVLEGGSIDVNGNGLLLTTEECLLSDIQARNPGVSREQLEQAFADFLGIRKTLWLRNGIAGDDTHGHVDDLARFTDAQTVVIAVEQDSTEPNYAPTQENLALLREFTGTDGQPLRIETLPMPRPVIFAGQRLPASYANFYIANNLVLVPTFNDPADAQALTTLQRLFPNRQVVGIHCLDLVLGLGTLHCMTQQQPAA